MAEKDDIPKGAADNLQKAAQQIAQVAKSLEKTFAKGGDFAKAMSKEVNETAKGAKTVRDHFVGIKDLNKDLASELTKNAEQQNIQNLALATGNSIAVATLQIEKEKAILLAREKGLGDSIVSKLEDKYNAAIQMTTELERQNTEQEAAEKLAEESLAHTEALKDKLKEITGYQGVFKDIFTDGRLAAGIFLNQVNKGMKNMTGLFDHARHEGMAISQAFHETGLAISDSFSLTGTSAKDSMEVMSGMRAEMGTLEGHTREARLEAASLARSFGISNEEAGKLTAQLSMMPGATMETANETARFAANMAKSAHVAPGEVLKDMAKNGENIAKFGKDGGKNMAVMAVAAKKVGLEMSTMANAAEGLLDFENSIEKQMEASVLLGREINLDKARQLALEGDLAGATKEMLANVGGEAEFNAMNVVQRKALADSMGVSVGELSKMVSGQDKLNDLTEDQQAALAAGEVTMDELAAGAGGLFDKLKNVGVTTFSLVKGFSTLSGLKDNIVKTAKMFGIESFKQVKATIAQGLQMVKNGAIQTALFIKKKAVAAWEFMTGKSKMAMDLKAHLMRMAQKAKEFLFDKSKRKEMLAGAKKMLTGGLKKAKGAVSGGVKAGAGAKKGAEALKSTGDNAGKAGKGAKAVKGGAGIKKNMEGLADGVAAFGKGKVILGALIGLPATAIGMITMVAAIPALTFLAIGGIAAGAGLTGLSEGIEKMAGGKVMMGILMVGVLGVSMIALGAAAMLFAAGGAAGTMLMVVSMYALVGALALMGGLGLSGIGFIGVALVLAMGAALLLMGLGVKLAAEGMAVLVEAFTGLFGVITLESLVPIFLLGPALGIAAIGMLAFAGSLVVLALAAIFGAPALVTLGLGMLALGVGVMLAAVGLKLISEIMPTIDQAFVGVATSINSIVALLPAMLMMGTALFGMAAGLAAFAIAGVFTLPTIMGLIALSLVAPILIALGNSINFDLGGGSNVESSPEDSKMDLLIEEVRALKAAFKTPGVINMDGQKVGDVIGLAVSTSGVS